MSENNDLSQAQANLWKVFDIYKQAGVLDEGIIVVNIAYFALHWHMDQMESLRLNIEANPYYQQRSFKTDFLELNRMGFDIMGSQTPITPILIGDSALAVKFSELLYEEGILVVAIRPPTVPRNTERLRLTVMATHTREDLDFLLGQIKRIGKELCLI